MDHAVSPYPDQRDCSVLYLSYDGMTDPLGGSQVLPYLTGLAERGHRIRLISFEKPSRRNLEREAVQVLCNAACIRWYPLPYHKQPPVLSSVYDVTAMQRMGERLHREEPADLVHCRSDIPALVGLAMKRRHRTRFLYDMRAFWPDERIEGGLWNLRNPLYRVIYRYFKQRQADFLREADHIVSLTEAGRNVLLARSDRPPDGPPIVVIPCCVDFDTFPIIDDKRRAEARALLGIAPERRVVAYLGSIGTWYMLGEMLDFFRAQLARDPQALFLLVTRDNQDEILAAAAQRGIDPSTLLIRPALRPQVPVFLAAADYGLFFIKPVFSKIASCPTKLGELLALGLPVVTNTGVGDVDRAVGEICAGVLISQFDDEAYRQALDRLATFTANRGSLRDGARRWFDLDQGIQRYDAIYREAWRPSPLSE